MHTVSDNLQKASEIVMRVTRVFITNTDFGHEAFSDSQSQLEQKFGSTPSSSPHSGQLIITEGLFMVTVNSSVGALITKFSILVSRMFHFIFDPETLPAKTKTLAISLNKKSSSPNSTSVSERPASIISSTSVGISDLAIFLIVSSVGWSSPYNSSMSSSLSAAVWMSSSLLFTLSTIITLHRSSR